jgi:hypothetical protein
MIASGIYLAALGVLQFLLPHLEPMKITEP